MKPIENLRPEQRDEVRSQVRALLERTDAFQQVPPETRRSIAQGLVDVVAFLADPAAGQPALAGAAGTNGAAPADGAGPVAAGAALAEPLQSAAAKTADRLAGKPDVVGKDFKAGGMEAGTKAFKELVDSVDFPEFVSGLIEGVFTSIVDSSLRQMEAYGKLLEGVVKSVEQYASDHISQNQARDYLGDRFPDTFSVDLGGPTPRLRLRSGLDDEEKSLENVRTTLGLKEAFDIDDDEGEAKLLRQAQLEMARLRQQQLATMVLLGINRIVVTDGLINAKVVFDVKASDSANRQARASMHDTEESSGSSSTSGNGWFSRNRSSSGSSSHKTVVTSSVDDTSESKAQLKANLTGEMRVNFRSETFPMDKMASQVQIASVNERAQR